MNANSAGESEMSATGMKSSTVGRDGGMKATTAGRDGGMKVTTAGRDGG